jgi:fructokinase
MARNCNIVALGEVLWDVFEDLNVKKLGGAPLNFVAHASRLGNQAKLISSVGNDELGRDALELIRSFGISTDLIPVSDSLPTGVARVWLGKDGQVSFKIERPAAYEGVALRPEDLAKLKGWSPNWLYFGTLFAYNGDARNTLYTLAGALPGCRKFYDLNLRTNNYSPELVLELMKFANVAKLNETEMVEVAAFAGLPTDTIEHFCAAGAAKFGWDAAAVTLGDKGAAVWNKGDYAEVEGLKVTVADTVGAGDAFAGGLVHGLSQGWSSLTIALVANQVGALIASRPGGIPDWNIGELDLPKEAREATSPSA